MAKTNEGDILMKPRVCIIKTDGTNCDQETAYAFNKAGAQTTIMLINQLKQDKKKLVRDFNIIVIPGGFSYGDDIAGGAVFSVELLAHFKEHLQEFIMRGNIILGICNGFQILARTGLLPFASLGKSNSTLTYNDSGHFECRWITMRVEKSPCIFTKNMAGKEIQLPVAHAEGKYITDNTTLEKIEKNNLVTLRYVHNNKVTQEYPHNPNGAMHGIAGLCDITGRIFGLMPHPERYVHTYHHPNWRRNNMYPHGLPLFENAVQYAKQS